jgi:hypothetical protein
MSPILVWEGPADEMPDFCPGGCGGLTEDPYGGPCRACWDKVPGPYPGDERCDWCQKFLSGDGFCDDGRIFCGEDCAGAYAAEWGVGLRSLALTEPCSPGPEHRLSENEWLDATAPGPARYDMGGVLLPPLE